MRNVLASLHFDGIADSGAEIDHFTSSLLMFRSRPKGGLLFWSLGVGAEPRRFFIIKSLENAFFGARAWAFLHFGDSKSLLRYLKSLQHFSKPCSANWALPAPLEALLHDLESFQHHLKPFSMMSNSSTCFEVDASTFWRRSITIWSPSIMEVVWDSSRVISKAFTPF